MIDSHREAKARATSPSTTGGVLLALASALKQQVKDGFDFRWDFNNFDNPQSLFIYRVRNAKNERSLMPSQPQFDEQEMMALVSIKASMLRATNPHGLLLYVDDFGTFIASTFCFGDNREVHWLPRERFRVVLNHHPTYSKLHSCVRYPIRLELPVFTNWLQKFTTRYLACIAARGYLKTIT